MPKQAKAVEEAFDKAGKSAPFKKQAEAAKDFNAAMQQGVKVTSQLANSQEGLKAQIRSLNASYAGLISHKKEFEAAGRSEELKKRLADIKTRLAEINGQLKETPKANELVKSSFDKVGTAIKTAFTVTGVLFLIDKLIEVGRKIIDITSESQKFQSQFTRIFEGNGEAATGYLSSLQTVADTTNFTFDELANNVAKLASRGIVPVKEELLGLGDVANFINKDFEQLSEAILDANNSERWKELGFTVKTQGDKMTLSYGSFSKTVDATAKGAFEAVQAFSALEKVQGSTLEAGTRLDGKMSSLADAFGRFFRTIGQGNTDALGGLINLLIRLAGLATDVYKTVEPAIQGIGKAFSAVGSAIGGVLSSFGNFQTAAEKTATFSQKLGFYFTKYVITPFTAFTLTTAGVIEGFNLIVQYGTLAVAKLSGNGSLEATVGAQIDATKKRIATIRADGAKLRVEAQRDLDTYVKQDNTRKAKEASDAAKAEAAAKAAVAKLGKNDPKVVKAQSDAEKKAATKALQDEKKLLREAEEAYKKELLKLEEQFGKDRLDALKKDSVEYIEADKQIKLKELELTRQQLIKLGQLASSTTTRKNEEGKLEVVANLNYKLPLEEEQKFNDARAKINADATRKTVAQKIRDELDILEIEKDSDKKQLDEFDKKWALQLLAEEINSEKYLKLIEKRNRDRKALEIDIELKNIAANRSIFDSNISLRKQGENETAGEFAKRNALDRNANDRYFNDREVGALVDLNDPAYAAEIQRLRAVGKAIREEQKKIELGPKYDSIFELLGVTNGIDELETDIIKQSAAVIGDALRSITATQVEESEKRIAAIEAEIDAKKQQIDEEKKRAEEGYANNLGLREQELEDLKRQKAEEENQKRAALKVQQQLDLATMASNNAVAISNMYTTLTNITKGFTTIPIAGVFLALGGIATIIAGVVAAKSKLQAISKLKKGGHIAEGRSHEQGGHRLEGTNYELEKGEFIVNKEVTTENIEAITELNKGNLRQAAMLLLRNTPLPGLTLPASYTPMGPTSDSASSRLLEEQNELLRQQNQYMKMMHEKPTETALGDGRVKITKGNNTTIKKF